MYDKINEHAELIITHLETGQQFVCAYPYLCEKLHTTNVTENEEYQSQFRKFWSMNQARLNKVFYVKYFECLETNKNNNSIREEISNILNDLYKIPQGDKKINKYQYSFVSKLCHMIDNNLSIYDNFIKSFYFLQDIDNKNPIESFLNQYHFLINEYSRIIDSNLLSDAIIKFNISKLAGLNYSNTKIVDNLIWAFIDLLYKNKISRENLYKC